MCEKATTSVTFDNFKAAPFKPASPMLSSSIPSSWQPKCTLYPLVAMNEMTTLPLLQERSVDIRVRMHTAEIWDRKYIFFISWRYHWIMMTGKFSTFSHLCFSIFFFLYYSINGMQELNVLVGWQARDWALLQFYTYTRTRTLMIDNLVTEFALKVTHLTLCL